MELGHGLKSSSNIPFTASQFSKQTGFQHLSVPPANLWVLTAGNVEELCYSVCLMRHFSLWYLEVKAHGLIMLKSPEVPSNTCPTSLRERRMIKSLYNIEFFRSRKNWIREESLYIKHYFLYFCMFLTTAAGCQSQQILV